MEEGLFESRIESLPLIHRGKVRDLYALGQEHLLIITTDRLSAFDVVLPRAIPGKGKVLTELRVASPITSLSRKWIWRAICGRRSWSSVSAAGWWCASCAPCRWKRWRAAT